MSSTSLDHPSKVNDGNNARSNATAGTNIITGSNIPSGTYNASIVLVISHTHNESNKGLISFVNVVNVIPTSPNKNRSEQVGNEPVTYEIPSSYAIKLSPTSLTKDNLRKLDAIVSNDADYDVWLPLDSVHEFSSTEGIDSVLRDVWVKFHDVPLVAYTYRHQNCYARVLIEINACINFNDNLVMVVPNLEGNRYTKETIRIEYEWMPPRCSTCFVYGHSLVDCPKAVLKRVVNSIDKGNGQTSGLMVKVLLNNSFEALDVNNPIVEEVVTDSDDDVEPVENETANFFGIKESWIWSEKLVGTMEEYNSGC
ncbi:primary amine oxidase-like protein [Tanacetum coccineum]